MNFDKILKKWRVMFLLAMLLWSAFELQPWSGLNLDWGFDIQGGSRVVLKPTNQSVELDDITTVLQNRLNVYGLRDIKVRAASDLQDTFVVVEAAGLTESDIESLLASEGYFEGQINNITVFTGEDVRVDKAGIQLYQDRAQGGVYRYSIPVILSAEATKKFAETTATLNPSIEGPYLDKNLDLLIDGKLLESLQISSDLRGREIPTAQVTGGAETRDEAQTNLNTMVAILMTGSIPTKMEIVSLQQVSPILGAEFLKSTGFAGILAAVFVGIVIFVRYRNPEMVGAIVFTAISELVITLAIASFINWQLDLAAIAGLIITIGTGVDQQIIMTDELLMGISKTSVKEAMFVILAAFGTMAAAMLPLMFIGVGAVRGFAVTTILGITVGYFITRPAYLAVLEEIV
jgi:preprotein translocase subunit SecD